MPISTAEEVARTTAPELIGSTPSAAKLDPWATARQIRQGTLRLTLPVEGTVGSWPSSVRFDSGTELELTARIEDGRLAAEDFSARLSQSGDAFLWTELEGAYLDEDRNLRFDVWGWPDPVALDLRTLPVEWSALLDRIEGGDGGEARGSPVDWDRARFEVSGAELAAGSRLPLPSGAIELGEGGRFDLRGGPDGLRAVGWVHGQSWSIATDQFAVDAEDTRARLEVAVSPEPGGALRTRVALSNLDGRLSSLAYRGEDHSYFVLREGRARGSVTVDVRTPLGEGSASGGRPAPEVETSVSVDLERFNGEIEQARLQTPIGIDGRPGQVELAGARIDGRIRAGVDGRVRLSGSVDAPDVGLRGLQLETADGPLHVLDARLAARGTVDYTPGRLVALGGGLTGAAVLEAEPAGILLGNGLLQSVDIDGGHATVRFDIPHFTSINHSPEAGLTLEGVEGRVGGVGRAERVEGRFVPEPEARVPDS